VTGAPLILFFFFFFVFFLFFFFSLVLLFVYFFFFFFCVFFFFFFLRLLFFFPFFPRSLPPLGGGLAPNVGGVFVPFKLLLRPTPPSLTLSNSFQPGSAGRRDSGDPPSHLRRWGPRLSIHNPGIPSMIFVPCFRLNENPIFALPPHNCVPADYFSAFPMKCFSTSGNP